MSGCDRNLSKRELLAYTMDVDNGLYKKDEKGGLRIEIVYRPSQLIAEQEVRGVKMNSDQVDSVFRFFQKTDYFLLRLSNNSHEIENSFAGDANRFNEINNYLSFEIGGDVCLVQNNDTIRAVDFIRTRTLGASPSTDILFAFKPGLNYDYEDAKFVFDDGKFATGLTVFEFNMDDIQRASSFHIIDKAYETD